MPLLRFGVNSPGRATMTDASLPNTTFATPGAGMSTVERHDVMVEVVSFLSWTVDTLGEHCPRTRRLLVRTHRQTDEIGTEHTE